MHYEERFSNLHAVLDGVHGHFRRNESTADAAALCRLRLAAHEWVANLVRHARFGAHRPEVHVRIWQQGALLRCTIEDNSRGFDLAAHLGTQPGLGKHVRTLPEGGMGLLLMEAGTERVEYDTVRKGCNRLHLAVRADETVRAEEASSPSA